MDVLFLRNPDTGEVRRFLGRASIDFYGWSVVDMKAWINANADHELVDAAVARYLATEAPATVQPADEAARGAANPYTWILPAELVTPEVKTVLNRLQSMLEAKGNENEQKIAALEAKLASAEAALAVAQRERDAAVAALRPFAAAWSGDESEDAWSHLSVYHSGYFTTSLTTDDLKRAAEALQASEKGE